MAVASNAQFHRICLTIEEHNAAIHNLFASTTAIY